MKIEILASPKPLTVAVGSGVFHEKACREFCIKRFTFFLRRFGSLGSAAFPWVWLPYALVVAASMAALVQGGIQSAAGKGGPAYWLTH